MLEFLASRRTLLKLSLSWMCSVVPIGLYPARLSVYGALYNSRFQKRGSEKISNVYHSSRLVHGVVIALYLPPSDITLTRRWNLSLV